MWETEGGRGKQGGERKDIHVRVLVSRCVGGSKAPPRTLYRIKCVLVQQFIQTTNYYKKHADGILQ